MVEAINANKGKLKYEDVEDLKADDEETDRLVQTFKSQLEQRTEKLTKARAAGAEGVES